MPKQKKQKNKNSPVLEKQEQSNVKKQFFIPEIHLPLAGLIGLFIYFCTKNSHIQDDAYITFRYVKNFIEGNGLVFNIGERVEGYTNFSWALLMSALAKLNFDIINISQNISGFFGVLAVIATFYVSGLIVLPRDSSQKKISNIENYDKYFNLIPIILIVFTEAFVYWAVSGMESSLFVFFVLLSFFFYLKEKDNEKINYKLGIVLALASLTRPEGPYIFAIIYAHKIFFIFLNNFRQGLNFTFKKIFTRNNLIEISIFIVPFVLHMLFRLLYYGHLFPNTFYAKTNFTLTSFETGLKYFEAVRKDYLLYGILLIAPVFLFKLKSIRFEVSFLYFFTIVYSVYIILVGGDVLALHRFWLPVLPVIYILFAKFINQLYKIIISKKPGISPSGIMLFLLVLSIVIGYYQYDKNKENVDRIKQLEIGLVQGMEQKAYVINSLQRMQGRRLTVAVSTIGALAYFTDANVIDLLGLTDETIAHHPKFIPEISNDPLVSWKERKYNADYIIQRKPDYILFSTGFKPSAFAERALFATKEFFRDYFLQYVVPPGMRSYFPFYSRKDSKQIALNNPLIESEKINPEWVKHYVYLIQGFGQYESTGDPKNIDGMWTEYNSIKKLGPSYFSDHHRLMGDLYTRSGDNEKAKQFYQTAIDTDVLNGQAQIGLINIYRNENNMEKAQEHIQKIEDLKIIIQL